MPPMPCRLRLILVIFSKLNYLFAHLIHCLMFVWNPCSLTWNGFKTRKTFRPPTFSPMVSGGTGFALLNTNEHFRFGCGQIRLLAIATFYWNFWQSSACLGPIHFGLGEWRALGNLSVLEIDDGSGSDGSGSRAFHMQIDIFTVVIQSIHVAKHWNHSSF